MILDRSHPKVKMNRRMNLTDINPHLMCVLCGGYYIDATTIIECLHSFCRSCIVKHLESSKYCPICEVMVHKTKPLINIRRDKTLQDIVYKLVPGLYAREMKNRQQFYKERPHYVKPEDESGGDAVDDGLFYLRQESYTVALRYHDAVKEHPRFYRCPVGVTIKHLQKLILSKFGLHNCESHVDILLKGQTLHEDLSLLDISCLYLLREPLEFSYLIYEKGVKKPPPSIEECKLSNRESKETEQEEVVEKEVQLQITETGLMKISEVDSRQVLGYKELDGNLPPLVSPVLENHVSFPVVITAPETIPVQAVAPTPMPQTQASCTKEEIPESKAPVIAMERNNIAGQKRLSEEREVVAVPVKRPSLDTHRRPQMDKVSEVDNSSPPNDVMLGSVKNIEERMQENQSAGTEVPLIGASSAVNDNLTPKEEKRKEDGMRGLEPKAPVATTSQTPTVVIPKLRPQVPKVNKVHKPIRSAPHIWHPVITKEKLRPTLMKNSIDAHKPSKIFKMRPMPRYLGNPASGVKPMYSNGLPPPPPPSQSPRVRIEPKTPRPAHKEEKKAPNTLLTSPFIPRDNHFLLPDPKTTQPFPTKISFTPAIHKNLPPCISHHYLTQPQQVQNLKLKDEATKNCDTEPSASSTCKEKEDPQPAVEQTTKCTS